MTRHVCVHGHFYQPPRENPWLDVVERQESAHPHHDWNERITAECYLPNSAARILNADGDIEQLVNNYSLMSFDFGPTLLRWLREHEPDVHDAVVEADALSRERFSGHGSAMAQGYHHAILPLCEERDLRTEIRWGLRDFAHRFGREAEGLWLPETAVDLRTLDELAAHGVRFVVLAPHQAARVREEESSRWTDVSDGSVCTQHAYRVELPSGRDIAAFFYDGPLSRAIAFEGVLRSGEGLAERLVRGFDDAPAEPALVHVATDGETYGHHHAHGDMALAVALERFRAGGSGASLTNYGEMLERHPPRHVAEVAEETSWSCAHGIERWRSDCGCQGGGEPGWNQAWRTPLRAAMDLLRDGVRADWEREAGRLFAEPWVVRDAYVDALLDPSPANVEAFLHERSGRALDADERTRALRLLELQRHALAAYTSCGWFFNDVSGIETVQVLRHAGRALDLAEAVLGLRLEQDFLQALERAPSNRPEYGDARRVHELDVRPARVEMADVAACVAARQAFVPGAEGGTFLGHEVVVKEPRVLRTEGTRLALGEGRVTRVATRATRRFAFGVLLQGDEDVTVGVSTREERGDEEEREGSLDSLAADFPSLADAKPALSVRFDEVLPLGELFEEGQRRVLEHAVHDAVLQAESEQAELHRRHGALIGWHEELHESLPEPFLALAELELHARLRRALSTELPGTEILDALVAEADSRRLALNAATIGPDVERCLSRLERRFVHDPEECAEPLLAVLALERCLPVQTVTWRLQNAVHRFGMPALRAAMERARAGDAEAVHIAAILKALARRLSVSVA